MAWSIVKAEEQTRRNTSFTGKPCRFYTTCVNLRKVQKCLFRVVEKDIASLCKFTQLAHFVCPDALEGSVSMDGDKGLELSLGLPCSGSSSNSRDRIGSSADAREDTDERTSKILNDFKNFLGAGIPQSFQKIDPVKPQEAFYNSFSHAASSGIVSGDGSALGDKRKFVFDEIVSHKKPQIETRSSDLQDKSKTSRVSVMTEEGSTADNEDVVDSEAAGSSSRMVTYCGDGSKTPARCGSSSQVSKEVHGNVNVGSPHFSIQPPNTLHVPYSITMRESPSVSAPSTSSYPLSSMMQAVPSTSNERSGPCTASPGSVLMPFGYAPVQLPVLDRNSHWGMVACPKAFQSPNAGRAISTSAPIRVPNRSSCEATQPNVQPSESLRGLTKELAATEEGSLSQFEDDAKGRSNNFSFEYPSIRSGIAADLKFDGSGSFPNLPWVSTTGPGTNGKTISGVTYKYSATQIKIVCACHGTHMSPDEFVQHACEEQPRPVTTPSLAPISSHNPAASAGT